MHEIAVLLSTRQRPAMLKTAVESILDNAVADTKVVVGFDDDDIEDQPELPWGVSEIVGPRPDSLGKKYDNLYRSVEARYYIYACDDIAYRSHGWDAAILDAADVFTDGYGVVYAGTTPDFISPIPIVRALSRNFVEKVGYFCPDIFPFWFDDTWIDEIAHMVDRVTWTNVEIELIGGRGKTRRCREIDFWQILFDSLRPQRIDTARRVIDHLDESSIRKELIRRKIPALVKLFQQRGANLRDQRKAELYSEKFGFETEPDAAYVRLKDRAIDLLAAEALNAA